MIFGENVVHSGGVLPVKPHTIDGNASVSSILQILQANVGHTYTATQPASGSVVSHSYGTVSPSFMMVDEGGGGYYDDYSSGYGWWDSGGGIDYGGSNTFSDGPAVSSTDAPRVEHLDGSISKTDGSNGVVNVYFGGTTSDGKSGDQLVTDKLSTTTSNILAATPDVNFVNVSATANGVHDTHSDHYSGNAVDINQINGNSVSSQDGTTLALQLEAQALADPHTRYVEGPGGNWVRSSEGGQWQRSANLPTMNNHVHWSTFRH